jgi:pre-mRNA-splicing factor CWC22
MISLDDEVTSQDTESGLNIFKFDPDFEENETKYKILKKEILDESSSDEDGDSGDDDGSDEDDDEEDAEEKKAKEEAEKMIVDETETNLVSLRRTVYLTIQSSLDFQECAHKIMKMNVKKSQEVELCQMILDACAQQRTYEKFFGLLAQRFCQIKKEFVEHFETIFRQQYETCHRLETVKLRNVSRLLSHLLYTDSISWGVFDCVHLNEDETTSSSRVYLKNLLLDLSEHVGIAKMNERFSDQTLSEFFAGIFPRDNPRHTRFSINFFTSIGLGALTEDLREHLKSAPKLMPPVELENTDLQDFKDEKDRENSDRHKSSKKSSKKSKKKSSKKKKRHSSESSSSSSSSSESSESSSSDSEDSDDSRKNPKNKKRKSSSSHKDRDGSSKHSKHIKKEKRDR